MRHSLSPIIGKDRKDVWKCTLCQNEYSDPWITTLEEFRMNIEDMDQQ
jgi:hypothetical protein